jgi:hypothetical protein
MAALRPVIEILNQSTYRCISCGVLFNPTDLEAKATKINLIEKERPC